MKKKLLTLFAVIFMVVFTGVYTSGLELTPAESAKNVNGILNVKGVQESTVFSGYGTKESPYLLSCASDILELATLVNEATEPFYASAYYKLTKNIDFEDVKGFTPIGSKEFPFSGNLDGAGYAVKNLSIECTDNTCVGFFGCGYNASVENFFLTNLNVSANCDDIMYVGGLFGYYTGESVQTNPYIKKCHIDGKITSTSNLYSSFAGGFVGKLELPMYSYVNVEDCYADVSISNTACALSYVGGICAYVKSGLVINRCVAMGNLYSTSTNSGSANVGGILGWLQNESEWVEQTVVLSDSSLYTIDKCISGVKTLSVKSEGTKRVGYISAYIYNDEVILGTNYTDAACEINPNSIGAYNGEILASQELFNDTFLTTAGYDLTNTWCTLEGKPLLKRTGAYIVGSIEENTVKVLPVNIGPCRVFAIAKDQNSKTQKIRIGVFNGSETYVPLDFSGVTYSDVEIFAFDTIEIIPLCASEVLR